MNTPICDFINEYAESGMTRFHMPGHKGRGILGVEGKDITEIKGADELFAPEGIIAESEANAAWLFGSGATLYSTEGSSLCIRTMLALVSQFARSESRTVLAGRNAHRAFITACALLDLDVVWLWPEEYSLCSCNIGADQVEQALAGMEEKPCAVYVTSPDYLGNTLDIRGVSEAAHRYNVPLVVDNAHGAYLKFLPESLHPLDLGADMCCDSAHKTLPVLTGGAYLHISKDAPRAFAANAKYAMSIFASTSPSYLILQSLDAANVLINESWRADLVGCAVKLKSFRERFERKGWSFWGDEALKLTICTADGIKLAGQLRTFKIECEYADPDYVVLMMSPYNIEELMRLDAAMSLMEPEKLSKEVLTLEKPEKALSIREAAFAPARVIPAGEAIGRIMASETLSCPPAISVAVSGEIINESTARAFEYYGIKEVRVVEQN